MEESLKFNTTLSTHHNAQIKGGYLLTVIRKYIAQLIQSQQIQNRIVELLSQLYDNFFQVF